MSVHQVDFFEYLQQIGLISSRQRKPENISLQTLSLQTHLPLPLIEFYQQQFLTLKQDCPEKLDESEQKKLPPALCRQFQCIPFEHDQKTKIACTNPYNLDMRQALDAHIKSPEYCLAPTSQIKQLIMTYFHEFTHIDQLAPNSLDQFIDHILEHGYLIFASDIHIQMQENRFQYKYRRFGQFQSTIFCPFELAEPFRNRLLIRSHVSFDELNNTLDCGLTLSDHQPPFTVRISHIPTQNGYSIEIRIIRPLLQLDLSTHLPPNQLVLLNQTLISCKDTIVIYGATGTGKSTLYYHLLKELVAHKKLPISIEDPIENVIPEVFQINMKKSEGTYAEHISQILRQDPDAIGISEIRSEEAVLGLSSAKMSGSLSIATIHALTPLDCLLKFLKMGYPRHELFNQNILLVATKLVPILCKSCRYCNPPTPEEQGQLSFFPELPLPNLIYQAKGCIYCYYTGIANTEPIIFVTDCPKKTLLNWIEDPAWQSQAQAQLAKPYETSLNNQLYQKLISGQINLQTFIEQCLS